MLSEIMTCLLIDDHLILIWSVLHSLKKYMISLVSSLFPIYQLSFSFFSCYETLQLKPRLPQFITGGTKAKALDKAG